MCNEPQADSPTREQEHICWRLARCMVPAPMGDRDPALASQVRAPCCLQLLSAHPGLDKVPNADKEALGYLHKGPLAVPHPLARKAFSARQWGGKLSVVSKNHYFG